MSLDKLPEDLPIPVDDGAADHLVGMRLPDISLPDTDQNRVSINQGKLAVFYIYPMTGRPDTPLPGGWNDIPGARGCTPESCSFRDHYSQLQRLDAEVYGISTQKTDYQREAKQRLHLPFELLSDSNHELKTSLNLPTFTVDGMRLYKRITLVAEHGSIVKVFYPVFPPDTHAAEVFSYLNSK